MKLHQMRLKEMRVGVRSAIAVSLLASAPGFAQPASTPSNTIQEIVVVAQKRQQNLQSVGITMNVLDADEFSARNYQNLSEAASAIANVELFEDFPSAGIPTWIIRGVGV